LGEPEQTAANLDDSIYPGYHFVAKVIAKTSNGGVRVRVKNKIVTGDTVDILAPGVPTREDTIQRITDPDGITQSLAQPGSTVTLYLNQPPRALDLIRRRERRVSVDR
jgi:putative protease